MRDIEKFQYMCVRVAELNDELARRDEKLERYEEEKRYAAEEARRQHDVDEARHQREMESLRLSNREIVETLKAQMESMKEDYKEHTERLMERISSLESLLRGMSLQERNGRRRLYGRKSEKL